MDDHLSTSVISFWVMLSHHTETVLVSSYYVTVMFLLSSYYEQVTAVELGQSMTAQTEWTKTARRVLATHDQDLSGIGMTSGAIAGTVVGVVVGVVLLGTIFWYRTKKAMSGKPSVKKQDSGSSLSKLVRVGDPVFETAPVCALM